MEILLILSFTFVLIFLITLRNRKTALKLTLFLVPYNLFSYSYLFAINNAAIYGLFMGNAVLLLIERNNYFIINNIKIKNIFILFFISLVISTVIMILGDINYQEMFFYTRSVESTTGYFILNLLTGPILFLLLANFVKELNELYEYIYIFILSVSYLFVSWLGYYFNYSLPNFLTYREMGGRSYVARFTGFWGDYELVAELCFIYIILAIILILNKSTQKKQKVIAIIVISVSIPILLSTVTRSIIFMTAILPLIFTITYSFTKKVQFINKIGIVLGLISVILIIALAISNSDYFVKRLFETTDIIKNVNYLDIKNIGLIANRNYVDTYWDILEVGSVFGSGPYLVSTFRGSWMVYHNLYYHIILSFGLTGLFIYLLFLYTNTKNLLFIAYKQAQPIYFIVFSLILTLHIDQFKINYWRDSPTIQIYWFIFAIAFILAHVETGKYNEKNIINPP